MTQDLLIVEDVDTMRSLLEQVVSAIPGFRVTGKARNVWEARLELTRRRPHLVLLDEILPGESSLDLLAEIRGQGIPVLLLTGLENPTHPLPEGASGRLVKPSWDDWQSDQERFRVAIEAALKSG
jgi:response regulator of citrate/malate metabolism